MEVSCCDQYEVTTLPARYLQYEFTSLVEWLSSIRVYDFTSKMSPIRVYEFNWMIKFSTSLRVYRQDTPNTSLRVYLNECVQYEFTTLPAWYIQYEFTSLTECLSSVRVYEFHLQLGSLPSFLQLLNCVPLTKLRMRPIF